MVQEIKELRPELDAHAFRHLEILEQREIPAIEGRASNLRRLVAAQNSRRRGCIDATSWCSRTAGHTGLSEGRCIQHSRVPVGFDVY